ncbi:hypothetical protein GMOD_00009391 [Pyrenophora seminiperda CCB06]|uniref:Uncharacterized protein n=1 Tax=Pyrenophora seminiperda CCB06 TaxID=1302712 RepID=A0A3M7MGJ5_9PLEO|nr:hypothetical protein GMOD_00009391 [Pyrenophora seminiperda CCB06]
MSIHLNNHGSTASLPPIPTTQPSVGLHKGQTPPAATNASSIVLHHICLAVRTAKTAMAPVLEQDPPHKERAPIPIWSVVDWQLTALICLPPILFWGNLWRLENYPMTGTLPCPCQDPSEVHNVSSSCPIDKHLLETPTQPLWLFAYTFWCLALVVSLIAYRNRPERLLRVTFWLQFLITVAIRCLSTFSGRTTQVYDYLIPPADNDNSQVLLSWNSYSIFKAGWIWPIIECPAWSSTYLGFYEDYYYQESTRMVYDRFGRPVWVFTSENTEERPRGFNHYAPNFLPWRDIVVRLSYYHVIDNAIHILWLRYDNTDAPYTTYINNSEFLTLALFVTLVAYTYARMRTHVYFDDDDDGILIDIKSPIPLPTPSVSRDLLTLRPWHQAFRTASTDRCGAMFCCLVSCFIWLDGFLMQVYFAVTGKGPALSPFESLCIELVESHGKGETASDVCTKLKDFVRKRRIGSVSRY